MSSKIKNCIDCNKCVKICPVDDLDIKNGFDIRCVQCGLCEIACEDVMMKHTKKHSLISKKLEKNSLLNSFSKNGFILGIITCVVMIATIYFSLMLPFWIIAILKTRLFIDDKNTFFIRRFVVC